jgi:aspartate/methionine/tyrosine aminotransferase
MDTGVLDMLRSGTAARAAIPPFHVMQIFRDAERRRGTGLPVYHLAVGQPSTPAPAAVRAAAVRALAQDEIGYTAATGIRPLREAIARHTQDWYGVAVDPANVVVTTGSSGGFLAAFLAAFDAGDTVALCRPGYPAYRNILASLGCRPVHLDCHADEVYLPSIAMLQALDPRPDGLVLASPANPTGAMVDAERLAAITSWCDLHGVRLVSDEIYHGISYGRAAASAWQFSRSPVVGTPSASTSR